MTFLIILPSQKGKKIQIKLFTLVIHNNYQNLFTFNLAFTEIPPLLLATEYLPRLETKHSYALLMFANYNVPHFLAF